jgi:hypothetical protein
MKFMNSRFYAVTTHAEDLWWSDYKNKWMSLDDVRNDGNGYSSHMSPCKIFYT